MLILQFFTISENMYASDQFMQILHLRFSMLNIIATARILIPRMNIIEAGVHFTDAIVV